jgi:heme/copper-type cytochrome/quinol oxidase subunit 2
MRGVVVVDEESAYQAWLQEQSTFKQTLADAGNGTGERSSLALIGNEAGSAEQVR